MINMCHDMLADFAPFLLSKVDRVNFGLLNKAQIEAGKNMPHSRKLSAIPFVGKDVPSRASQFSHPDVVIGLTILAFRYEGLRYEDFVNVLTEMKERLDGEFGPLRKRKTSKLYESWVELAGGMVKGRELGGGNSPEKNSSSSKRRQSGVVSPIVGGGLDNSVDGILSLNLSAVAENEVVVEEEKEKGKYDEIWPLHLLDLRDEEHTGITFELLRKLPHAAEYLLNNIVFPDVMEHFGEKISASGQGER